MFISAVLVYLNALKAEFVFDDIVAVVQNRDVDASATPLKNVFLNNYWGDPMNSISARHVVRIDGDGAC